MIQMSERYNVKDIPLATIVSGLFFGIGYITKNDRKFIFR